MKKLLLVLLAVMLVLSASVCTVFATNDDDATNETDDMGVELNFQADGFLRNLKYMGLGMLGIFVVVGVVILITFGLNAVTTKKKSK